MSRFLVLAAALCGLCLIGKSTLASAEADMSGTWAGQYVCPQGPTNVTIDIWEDSDKGTIGRFRFEPPSGESEGAGSFLVQVQSADTSISLVPLRWERRPGNYEMVGASLQFSPDSSTLLGHVEGTGCGSISLARVKSATATHSSSVVNAGAEVPNSLTLKDDIKWKKYCIANFVHLGKKGVIDEEGRLVIQPSFDFIDDFVDGLAQVSRGASYGFINSDGAIVIGPHYSFATRFSEGLARVKRDSRWGFVNKAGEEVIPPQFSDVGDFSEGLAPVTRNGRLWGFIDKSGREVLPARYQSAGSFWHDHARVTIFDRHGLINKRGEIVLPTIFNRLGEFHEGLAYYEGSAYEGAPNKMGFIEIKDNVPSVAIAPVFTSVDDFSDGFARITDYDNYGYIDRSGKIAIPIQFSDAGDFKGGTAVVRDKSTGKYGAIDKTGRLIIPYQFDELENCKSGPFVATSGGITFLLDKNGRRLPDPKIENVEVLVARQKAVDEEISRYLEREREKTKNATGNGGVKSIFADGARRDVQCSNGAYGMLLYHDNRVLCASGAGKAAQCDYKWDVSMAADYLCR